MTFLVDPVVEEAICLRGGYLSYPVVPEQHRVGHRTFIRISAQDTRLQKFLLKPTKSRYVRRPFAGFGLIVDLTNARNEAVREWALANAAESGASANDDSHGPPLLDLGLDDEAEEDVISKRRKTYQPLPSAHPQILEVNFKCRYTGEEHRAAMLWEVGRKSVYIEFTSENMKLLLSSIEKWQSQASAPQSHLASAPQSDQASATQSDQASATQSDSVPAPSSEDATTSGYELQSVWLQNSRRWYVCWKKADGKRKMKYVSALRDNEDDDLEAAKSAAYERMVERCRHQQAAVAQSASS